MGVNPERRRHVAVAKYLLHSLHVCSFPHEETRQTGDAKPRSRDEECESPLRLRLIHKRVQPHFDFQRLNAERVLLLIDRRQTGVGDFMEAEVTSIEMEVPHPPGTAGGIEMVLRNQDGSRLAIGSLRVYLGTTRPG